MHSSDSSMHRPGSPTSAGADAGSVWDRLREQLDRLAAGARDRQGPEALAKKLASRAALLRGRAGGSVNVEAPLVFLAFNKGPHRYGIPIDQVLEVQALDHFTPVPRAPPFLPGVIHWRGAILALLDLGRLFGIPESGLSDAHVAVIVEAAGRRIAVVAREVEELLLTPASQISPPPALPGQSDSPWLAGVCDQNRLLVRMDAILRDGHLVGWRKE